MSRFFEVKIIVENSSEPTAKALQEAKKLVESFGLKAADVKPVMSQRTSQQNAALHLFFTQLSEELNEKGLDMRHLIRPEIELSWTPYNVKEYLWRPLQKALTGKKSTTKLDKTQEIDLIYDNLNRIITERTKGEVQFPPFPSIENIDYMKDYETK